MNKSSHLYICAVAMRLGITEIVVDFSGAGDSGDVNEVIIEGIDTDALKKIPVTSEVIRVECKYGDLPNDVIEWRRQSSDSASNMYEWITQWCVIFATGDNRVTWDWYTNDGGGGTVTFFPMEGRFEVEGYYNETVATDIKDAPNGGPDWGGHVDIVGINFAPYVKENANAE